MRGFLQAQRICATPAGPTHGGCVTAPQGKPKRTSSRCRRLPYGNRLPVRAAPVPPQKASCQIMIYHDLTCRNAYGNISPASHGKGCANACSACLNVSFHAVSTPQKMKIVVKMLVSTACHSATFFVETHTVKSVENMGYTCHFSTLLKFSTKFRATRPYFFNTDFPYKSTLFTRCSLTYVSVRPE